LAVSHYLVLLAEEGLRLLAEALVHMDTPGEHYHAAEVYWLKGELLLRQALDIARHQQARALLEELA
jgi:hypothetical protein